MPIGARKGPYRTAPADGTALPTNETGGETCLFIQDYFLYTRLAFIPLGSPPGT